MIKYFLFSLVLLSNLTFAKNVQIVLTENNAVMFNQAVSAEYTAIKTLEIMRKSINKGPLYLVLNTPGGSVFSGLAFVDAIKALNIPIHTVTIFAASMGYQFVQELGTRYITGSGTLMSHRGAASGVSGQIPGELTSRVAHLLQVLSGMSSRAAARVGMSKKDYDAAIINELWVSGEDAVKQGHADAVADVRCSEDLIKGTYQEEVTTFFGVAILTLSKCPLISVPVAVSFSRDVKKEDIPKFKRLLNSRKNKAYLTF